MAHYAALSPLPRPKTELLTALFFDVVRIKFHEMNDVLCYIADARHFWQLYNLYK